MEVGTTTIRTTQTQVGSLSSTIAKEVEAGCFVSFEDVTRAYFDCRKNKRRKHSALVYEMNYEENNYDLWMDLNNGTYEIGKSICFCVTRPKLREVFAADFRDRIVHHLLMNKFLSVFEEDFVEDTYNCRVGKGVLYGVNRIRQQAGEIGKDGWFLKIDISGFFMSIDKDILWDSVEKLIREKGRCENLEWWLALLKKVIYHRPERNCIRRGDITLWDKLDPNKSLFHSNGKGLPIGNLTSQILANHYNGIIDKWFLPQVMGYGRYVDDIILLDADRRKLLNLIPSIRAKMKEICLVLHERKIVFQRIDKGIPFTGYIIQPFGVYAGSRLRRNAIAASTQCGEGVKKALTRINSYLGFLRHSLSYGIRYRIWNKLTEALGGAARLYATSHIHTIKTFDRL